MTVAAWILTSVLVVVVTMVVLGAALRPYVADLVDERNHWRLRAEQAEAELQASGMGDSDVKIIDAQADLDVFLKGLTDE